MSADIFISYSSKDKEKADQLTELLVSAGLSVWIDQSGIDVATSWSGEIVDAIEGCKAFVVLLSPNSIGSRNVIKEVALAAEKGKKILPLDLEPVALTRDLQYHLAGIQRAPMTNIDAIIRSLGKLGLEATKAPTLKLVKESDSRKSLMILPFEDLSPTGDNGWFADGIVSELIGSLSNIKSLRLMDQQETKSFKHFKGHLSEYARTMSIRYFVQGDVRKFGDQIKISSRLLDIETGDHLWQDSMKGTMDDIFDIQEKVAKKVVEGLKVHLASDEKKKLAERGTENAEAYELAMKAREYFLRSTKEGFELAEQLFSEAIRLDPDYAQAYVGKAYALAERYRAYVRDPRLLDESLELITTARRMKPDLLTIYLPLSTLLMLQGKLEEGEAAAKEYVRLAPDRSDSHFALGFFYAISGQPKKAIPCWEEGLRLEPDHLTALQSLVLDAADAHEPEKKRHWAEVAIPLYQKHLKLFPDDQSKRVHYADLLLAAGRNEEARAALTALKDIRDGGALYNTACIWNALGEYEEGAKVLRKALQAGFGDIRSLQLYLEDEDNGIGKLKGTPEWEEVRKMVEVLSEP